METNSHVSSGAAVGADVSRRAILKAAAGAVAAGLSGMAVAAGLSGVSMAADSPAQAGPAPVPAAPAAGASKEKLIWGNLLHLSINMWSDRPVAGWGQLKGDQLEYVVARPVLRFDETLWNDLLKKMAEAGMNMVVIDLGDAVAYESHPEIAVKNAWSRKKLREELDKVRKMGLEPIPKMNFSTSHDAWLWEYSRCVSTPTYYRVCGELIEEVCKLFDKPRFFHLGYDEENFGNQAQYAYAVVRQHELWWHDFDFFVKAVQKQGVRPWIWSDYAWNHWDDFAQKMPKSVMQSNWYYGTAFDKDTKPPVGTYLQLEKLGFDQIPTASNWSTPANFKATVEYCRKHIDPSRLKGFLQTPWKPTLEACREHHLEAIELVRQAIVG